MTTLTLPRWFARTPSADPRPSRAKLRVGIPRVLNLWSTHQFWCGLFGALGIDSRNLIFSSDTSEEQGRQFGKGRGTVDCCYPVKCISGHYGELVFGQKQKLDILFSPMIYTLPSFLSGHVARTLSCPRVMAAPENIKAGFLKERDVFAENGIRYVTPFVSLDEPKLVPKQLFEGLREVLPGLTMEETARAVTDGYRALTAFNERLRKKGREILEWCAREDRPCLLVLARPYHMDPGIGHEIEVDLQAYGYPVLWAQYFPIDADLMDWAFGPDVRAGVVKSPFDIRDVWPSSYSSNTNEILWARQGRRAHPVDRVRDPPRQLRVRHGPADVHAGAADRRALGHALLLVPGPRLDQAGRLGEDPRGDDHALPREVRAGHHREEEGGRAARLSARGVRPR